MSTPAERLAERVAAAAIPFRPRAERAGQPSRREIACRRCGRWTVQDASMAWHHTDDGTPACIDPAQLWAEADAEPAICYHAEHCGATAAQPCTGRRPRPTVTGRS